MLLYYTNFFTQLIYYLPLPTFYMILHIFLGSPKAYLYSVEFQKRCLSHAHILLWLRSIDIIHADQIDKYISAEIPNPDVDPELHDIVVNNMIHKHSPVKM